MCRFRLYVTQFAVGHLSDVVLVQGQSVTVTDFNGNNVAVDYVPVPYNASVQTAVFSAYIPAAGFSTYFLEFSGERESQPVQVRCY